MASELIDPPPPVDLREVFTRDFYDGAWRFVDRHGDRWRLVATGDPWMPLIINIEERAAPQRQEPPNGQ